jgi:hypothetical protein
VTTVADRLVEALEERDYRIEQAFRLAARLNELQTDLSCVVADIEDDQLAVAVAAIRRPVIDAGNRLARLRRHV